MPSLAKFSSFLSFWKVSRTRPAAGALSVAFVAMALSASPSSAQCVDWGAGPGPTPWTFDLLPDGGVIDLEMVGTTAWMARTTYGALVGVDMSDPIQPAVIGEKSVAIMDETYQVEVSGDLAFLTYIQWGGPAGVRVFDISDPAHPLDAGDFRAPGNNWAYGMAARGNHLFVSFPYTTVGVLDLSDPALPVLIGQVPVAYPYDLALDGDLLYVATDAQPRIIDVSDPTLPVLVSVVPTTSKGNQVAPAGDLAFVATFTGLEIFDVTDPTLPTPVGALATTDIATSIDLSGDLAYVFVHDTGVHVIDVRDVSAPVLVGVIPVPAVQWAPVHVSGEHVYVADDPAVFIAPRQCPLAPADAGPLPTATSIRLQAAPNPFNPQTVISFALPATSRASLDIFDAAGHRVRVLIRDRDLDAGSHTATWDGRDDRGRTVPSGTYLCRLAADRMVETRLVTLLR